MRDLQKEMPQVTESKEPAFEKTVRISPRKMHGEGHYLALLQKGEKSEKLVVKEKEKAREKSAGRTACIF